MRFLVLLKLKWQTLFAARGLMILLLIVPLMLGLIAGTANRANRQAEIRLAVIDLDQTATSQMLVENLRELNWDVSLATTDEANRKLVQKSIDGILTIQPGFDRSLETLEEMLLSYRMAEGSLVTTVVAEAVAAEVLPEHTRRVFLSQLEDRYRSLELSIPDDLSQQFDEAASVFAQNQARLDIIYTGAPVRQPALTYIVSDYSMEVFFLSIYAVLGSLLLSGSLIRRRLMTTPHGLVIDYALSLLTLFLMGLIQIMLYSVAMYCLMQSPIRIHEWGLLAVCLLLMLGLGQLLNLLHDSIRLFFSLLILLVLGIASGCFFQLTEPLITKLGQYLPQGWTLAALYGYPVLPPAIPVALAFLLFFIGYITQVQRTRQMR